MVKSTSLVTAFLEFRKVKKEVTAMSVVGEIFMNLFLGIGGYVYGRWKQKI